MKTRLLAILLLAAMPLAQAQGPNVKVINTASQPVPVTGSITSSGGATAANQTTANTSLASIDTKTPAKGQATMANSEPVTIASDQPALAAPTLTKGTQSATGYNVQELHDAGRTQFRWHAVATAAGTTGTETAITLTQSSGTSANTTAASFTPSSGKRFRITSITLATRGNATATAQTTTFSIRVNTAGAVTTTSTPVIYKAECATPATAGQLDRVVIPIQDGDELAGDGTMQWGVTANSTYVTNAPTWDVLITGYEY